MVVVVEKDEEERQRRAPGRRQPVAMLVAHALTVDRCIQGDPMRARFAHYSGLGAGRSSLQLAAARCKLDAQPTARSMQQQLKRTRPHPKPTVVADRELERGLQLYKQDPRIDCI